MDIEVVKTVETNLTRSEIISLRADIGNRCGRIQVEFKNRLGMLVCRCDCGETISLSPKKFSEGKVHECQSCQKWRRKTPAHKYLGKAIYKSFLGRGKDAQQRCENPNHKFYYLYGGKGKRFKFKSPEEYALYCGSMALVYGPDKQVDRIDNDGHYEAGNIRMTTAKDNIRNRSNTFKFCDKPIADVVDEMGFAYDKYTISKARDYFRGRGKGRKNDPTAYNDLKSYLMNSGSEMAPEHTLA